MTSLKYLTPRQPGGDAAFDRPHDVSLQRQSLGEIRILIRLNDPRRFVFILLAPRRRRSGAIWAHGEGEGDEVPG